MSATVNEKILNALNMYNEGLQEKISENYVEKDGNKVLSSNDFTTAEKEKLGGLSNFDPETLSDTFVFQVAGKDLSTNDFTDDYKIAVDGLSSTYVQKDGGKVLSTNDFTNDYKFAIDGLSGTYAKKSDVASVLKYKGTVLNFSAIPSDTSVGDVWNISIGGGVDENGVAIKDGDNVAKTPTGFDVLAGSIDLSGYVEKDGNKVLSSNDFTDADKAAIDGLSSTYVQKDGGKVLSTNDFTDDYKAAIDGLSSAGSNFDPETLTDTFVLQVAGKVLSSNDFTDADKTKLDNLPAISVFMKALLETKNATEARSLLKVGREDIWDETGNRWNCVNAFLDTGTKKIGTSSLHTGVNNGYLVKPDGITLGGSYGFTIAFWAYASSSSTAAQGFWSFGSKASMLQIFRDASNKIATNCVVNGSAVFSPAAADRTAYPTSKWTHVELDYNASNGYIYLFLNGTCIYSIACSFFSTAQNYPMYIGLGGLNGTLSYFTGWIDEFVVLKTCLHTANFTPPTSAYTAGTNTLALLHFD